MIRRYVEETDEDNYGGTISVVTFELRTDNTQQAQDMVMVMVTAGNVYARGHTVDGAVVDGDAPFEHTPEHSTVYAKDLAREISFAGEREILPSKRLEALRSLIADDAHAATFQSMAQYRNSLLRYFDEISK